MNKFFSVTKVDRHFHSGHEQKRDCFSYIENYLNCKKEQSEICVIYGIKETGTTTLLRQAAETLSDADKNKALFIECFEGSDFYDLLNFMYLQIEKGYRYFL